MQTLKDSELRYRRLFEAAQDGILILDARTGMITDVNPFLINMLGYSREEFVEKKLWEVGAFKDIEASKHAFEVLRKNEYIRYKDLPLKTKGGQLIQVEFVSNVYLAGSEKVIQCSFRDITERKRAEDALRKSETGLKEAQRVGQLGSWDWDAKTDTITWSEEYYRIYGFDPKQPPPGYEQHLKAYTPESAARLDAAVKKSMETGEPYALDLEQVRPDGTRRWVTARNEIKRDANGQIIGLRGTAQDITERKQAEEELVKLRKAVDNSGEVIFMTDRDGLISFANPEFTRLFGYTAEEVVGQSTPRILKSGLIEPEGYTAMWQTILSKQVIKGEFVNKTKDGRLMNIEGSINPILDDDGNIDGYLAIQRDITERKQAEEALRESEERFRARIENSSDLVTVTGLDGIIQYESPSIEHLLGYKPEELVGANAFDFMHPDDRERVMEIFAQNIQNPDSPTSAEFRFRHRDGSWRAFEGLGRGYLDEHGQMAGLINSRDVTERKLAEEALQTSEDHFKTIFDQAPLGIALVGSLMGHIYEVNPRFAEIAGRSMEEMANVDWMQITHPADLQADLDNMALLNAGKISGFQMEKRYLHPDGTAVWINMTIAPLKVEDKAHPLHLCMIEDITNRKAAEERIRRQLGHLTALSTTDRVIAANFDLKLSLSEILSHVTMELGIDAADILILNSNSQMLEFGAERGFRTQAVRKAQVRLGENYAGRAALERQLVQIPNLRADPDNFLLTTKLAGEDFVCYYGVPLIAKGQVNGVLEVFHRAALEPDPEWFDFLNALAGRTAIAIENATLFENQERSNVELTLAYDATIEGWSRALDLRDKETEGHTQRVTEMTVKLARAFGLGEVELVQVRWGALLHDIGKMGVPDRILQKPEPLTDEEWAVMKKHPGLAYEMLSPIRYLRQALDIPYCHHEKWDGSGYPRGLKGAQIPLVARIFAVVDVWDALKSDRPYRAGWTEEKVLEHIRTLSGTHLDPQVVDTFMRIPN